MLLLVLPCNEVEAQTKRDSLWAVWKDTSQPDTTRLQASYKMVWDGYIYTQPDSAYYFAQLQYDFAEKTGHKKLMQKAVYTQAVSFWVKGDYPLALKYCRKSLALAEEIKDKKGISNSVSIQGSIYNTQGSYPQAIQYYLRSLQIDESIGEKKGIAANLNNIGVIYQYQRNYPRALDYYQRSLLIQESLGNRSGVANNLNNIGEIHFKQSNYVGALDYFQRSLKIREEIGGKTGIGALLNNFGEVYMRLKNYPRALEYLQRSLKSQQEIGSKPGMVISLNSIGELYNIQGLRQRALASCEEGYALAHEIGSMLDQQNACRCLYSAHKALGNGSKALAYHEEMMQLSDSLSAGETEKKLQHMEFAKQIFSDSIAEVEKDRLTKEAYQEDVSRKNRTKNMALVSGFFLLIIAAGLFSRVQYVRKSKAIIEKERDRSDNLLLNILPEEIAKELKEKGKAEARDFEMVSILFSDFSGFTTTSEKLTAKELVAEINTCFEAFDAIMEKYGIEKIKTIGDAYMAAGGLPVPSDTSTKSTVLAGLEMQVFIEKRKAEKKSHGLMAFGMRVGIHTGPVVAGIVGVKKFQYDIWGDTVNTASRIENNGEEGKVNISLSTYGLLKDDRAFLFESRGKIEAKGKGEIEMYFVSNNMSVSQ